MDDARRKRLEAAGWKFGTVKEFLNLTDEEEELVEERLKSSRHNHLPPYDKCCDCLCYDETTGLCTYYELPPEEVFCDRIDGEHNIKESEGD